MIPFNFDYYKAHSIEEAVRLFDELDREKMQPLYYSGGTEIITFARKNDLFTGAVIDIKGIPECSILGLYDDQFVIGSAVTLTAVGETNLFPLLTATSTFAADHTARSKITFGGNICGRIMFREAVLTPLITNAQVVIAGKRGLRMIPINQVFQQKMLLNRDEFLVQIHIDRSYEYLPHYAVKKTKISKPDYPLVSMAALKKDNQIRIALSGVCAFPFRSLEIEEILNQRHIPPELRVEESVSRLPAPILDNVQGGKEYREFILKNTLLESLLILEGK